MPSRVILRQSVVGLMPSASAARSRLPSQSRSAASIACALGVVDDVGERAAAARRRVGCAAPAAGCRRRVIDAAACRARRPARPCSRARGCCPGSRSCMSASSTPSPSARASRSSSVVLVEEELDEQRDVLAALAQRRQLEARDVEAVVEVLAEALLRDRARAGPGWSRR